MAQPLPAHLCEGHTLTADDMRELAIRVQSRDGLLRMYQKLLIDKEQRLRDFLSVSQHAPPEYRSILSSRTWKLVMLLHRLRYRLMHPLARSR